MSRPTRALIDLDALRHNLRRAREAAPGARVLAVIKANAYGHGQLRVARALADADGFAVASIDEALTLRDAGISKPILLLEGCFSAAELKVVSEHRLDVVVHHETQLDMLERCSPSAPINVWLKVNTGMQRLGVAPEKTEAFWRRLIDCKSVAAQPRLMTHLANADDRNDQTTMRQLDTFRSATTGLDAERSIANSAGTLGWPAAHADWIRPGIMLYGISPFTNTVGGDEGLRPVMTLTTQLIAVNRANKGAAVGYGGTWTAPEDMLIGVATIGYGDGYPRHASTGTPVLVNGERVPLVGRVSMDMITLDLRTQPDARPGDPVVLWGKGLPAEQVAEKAGTIAYELVCGVAPRVEFVESGRVNLDSVPH